MITRKTMSTCIYELLLVIIYVKTVSICDKADHLTAKSYYFSDTNVCWRMERNYEIRNNGISQCLGATDGKHAAVVFIQICILQLQTVL